MSSNPNRSPLFDFEINNYPDGKRKCARLTIGSTATVTLLLVLGLLAHVPIAKIMEALSAWKLLVK